LYATKIKALVGTFNAEMLDVYVRTVGCALAPILVSSGISATISSYLGSSSDEFDAAMDDFALAHADHAERDHAVLKAAVQKGRITVCQESTPS
jgi:hypothetical protein